MKHILVPLAEIALPARALQQHTYYLRCVEMLGGTGHVTALHDSAQVVGQAQIIRRRIGPLTLDWLARGPYWTADPTSAQKKSALQRFRAQTGLSILQPDTPQDAALFDGGACRALITPCHVAEIDLTRPEAERLGAQHGKWRNRLRHAKTRELIIENAPLRPAEDNILLQHEARQRAARGYTSLPARFTEAWAHAFPHETRMFRARNRQGVCAFMLVLLHAPVATYHIGWTDEAGRAASAHNLLLWEASNWLTARGFTRFDLGLVDTEASPGLARFKIGAGARVRPLGPTLLHLPSPLAGLRRIYRAP